MVKIKSGEGSEGGEFGEESGEGREGYGLRERGGSGKDKNITSRRAFTGAVVQGMCA